MAAVQTVDNNPTIFAASTSEQAIALNSRRRYRVFHDAVAADGTTAATANVGLAFGEVSITLGAVGANVALLKSGRDLTVGPGVNMITVKAASGAPTLTIVPDGELFHDC